MIKDFFDIGGDGLPPGHSKFDATARLEGKLFGSETIIIEGQVKGEIVAGGSLEITQNAAVNGSVKADKLFLYGKVEGSIDVAGSLSVGKTAVIQGDVKAGEADIKAGAIINGQCSIGVMPDYSAVR